MINAALEELIKQRYEMPAFSTLDRLTRRVRTLVYGRICRMVQRRMTLKSSTAWKHSLRCNFPRIALLSPSSNSFRQVQPSRT